jgi:hypothetical protein
MTLGSDTNARLRFSIGILLPLLLGGRAGGELPEADAENLYLLRIDGAANDLVISSRLPRGPKT